MGQRQPIVELKMPWLAPDVAKVTVSRWLVDVGHRVEIDQDIMELTVDGEIFLLPSPLDGVILSRAVGPGDYLDVGQVLAEVRAEL